MQIWKRFLALIPLLVLVSCGTAQDLLHDDAALVPGAEQSSPEPPATAPGRVGQGQAPAGPVAAQQPTVDPAEGDAATQADVPVLATAGRGALFSKAEDNRPWPTEGTKEAKRQEDFDNRRERELGKTMMICKGC
jgi:hypothetical protein